MSNSTFPLESDFKHENWGQKPVLTLHDSTAFDVKQDLNEILEPEVNLEMPVLSSPFNFDVIASMSDQEIEGFRDDRGFNILMLAAEAGRVNIVQCIIDAGEDVNFEVEGETAINLAYKGGHHEVVLALLRANSKFPENFDKGTTSDELKIFVNLSNQMHFRVKEANEDDLEHLKVYLGDKIEANPKVRYFYDSSNCSLLKCAILSRKFLIYEFLLSLNIFLAHHESMDEIVKVLTVDERRKLSDINLRISPNLMTEEMMILMRNCKLSPDSPKGRDAEFMFFIRKAFDELFMIPAVAIVFRVVAASRNFKIIFDFKRDSVTFLDPKSEPFCEGLMYSSGKIYVGAKDLLNPEASKRVFGIIAHELCHYAMFLCYQNYANPYKEKYKESKARFSLINEECEKLKDAEDLVGIVYEEYDKSMQHAELIARVPHMIGLYFDDLEILNGLRETFKNLFEFYEQTCMPQMEAELPRIERKFSPFKEIEEKVKRQTIWIWILVVLIALGSILSVVAIYSFLPVSWSELDSKDQNFIKNSKVEFYGVEVKFGELFAIDSKIFDSLSSEQIKKTLKGETEELSKALNETLHHQVFLTWSNMTKELKEKFLTSEVDFQGQKVLIGNLTKSDRTLKLLDSKQIQEIFTESSFKVSFAAEQKTKVFIERFFVDHQMKVLSERTSKFLYATRRLELPKIYKDGKVNTENENVTSFDQIVNEIKNSKVFLLSSAAGDGKSTTFRHFSLKLKEKFPRKWIQFVDLKKHFEAFDKGQQLNLKDFEVLSNFLGEKVLSLESFELELFKELFTSGDVYFLWDGVDEISPKFKNFMLDLTENILRTQNFQFISTRPQHSKDFEEKLKVKAQKLIPFSELDRFEFLVKTIADLKFNENGEEIFDELKNFYDRDFKHLNLTQKISQYKAPIAKGQSIFRAGEDVAIVKVRGPEDLSDSFVSNPLLVSMISEMACNEEFQVKVTGALNIFKLYQIFIQNKLGIVDDKGELIKAEKNKNFAVSSANIWQAHQYFALDLISNSSKSVSNQTLNKIKSLVKKSLKTFKAEVISRFGILQVNSETDFDFAHRSFAEFFAAQFFLDNIFNFDEREDVNNDDQRWKVSLLFGLIRDSKLLPFIVGASIEEKYTFHNDPEFMLQLIKSASSNDLNQFENILWFLRNLPWMSQSLVGLNALYNETKSSKSSESFHWMLTNFLVDDIISNANLRQELKEKFEALKLELSEKSKEGVEEFGTKIRNGNFDQMIEWSKRSIRESFILALPDLIKSAYSNDSSEFLNVLKFIRNFHTIDQAAVGLSVLHKEMKSKNDQDSLKLMMLDYLVKEEMAMWYYKNIEEKYKQKFETLKLELSEKSAKRINDVGFKIRNSSYDLIIEWSRSLTSSFELALADLIKSAYSKNFTDFLNVLKFVQVLPFTSQGANGLLAFYDEMKSKNDFEIFKVMILDYSVKEQLMQKNQNQEVRTKLETLKKELSERSKEGIKESGIKIRKGLIVDLVKWAWKFNWINSSFELALPDFIKSAYSNDFNEFLNVLKFIQWLRSDSGSAVGLSVLYEEMKSKNDLESFKLMMINYIVVEIMNHPKYSNVSKTFKERIETLKLELMGKSKEGVEELGTKIKNGDFEQIIEWAKKLKSNEESFNLALSDLIKFAYSNDSSEFQNILKFIRNLPQSSQSAIALSAFYEEIKGRNDLENFQLMTLDYFVRREMEHENYSKIQQKFKDMFESLTIQLKEKSKKGVEEFGTLIRKDDYQKLIEWSKESIADSFNLALPDLIKAAFLKDLQNFETTLKFIGDLPFIAGSAIGLSALYDEMSLSNDLESFELLMLAQETKRVMDLPLYPTRGQKYKNLLENLKKVFPSSVRDFIWSSRENCTIKSESSSEILFASDLTFDNESAQVLTSTQENLSNSSFKWSIQTENFAKTFSIKNEEKQEFLSASDENFEADRRRVLLVKSEEEKSEKFHWQIISKDGKFLIVNAKFNESLIASDEKVFTSKLNEKSEKEGKWKIKCDP